MTLKARRQMAAVHDFCNRNDCDKCAAKKTCSKLFRKDDETTLEWSCRYYGTMYEWLRSHGEL